MNALNEDLRALARSEYKYGFVTDLETDTVPRGLSEDVVRLISAKKNEPDWLLECPKLRDCSSACCERQEMISGINIPRQSARFEPALL